MKYDITLLYIYGVVTPPLNGVQPPRVFLVVFVKIMFRILAVFYPVGDMHCVLSFTSCTSTCCGEKQFRE